MNENELAEFETLSERVSFAATTIEDGDNVDLDTGKVALGSVVARKAITDLKRMAVLLEKEEAQQAPIDPLDVIKTVRDSLIKGSRSLNGADDFTFIDTAIDLLNCALPDKQEADNAQ